MPYASAWLHDVLATPPSTLPQHWLLCALANKWATPDSAALERIWQSIPDAPPDVRSAALDAWVWTACGWLSRAEPIGQQMLDTLYTGLVQDARLGMQAAHALRVLTLHSRLVSPSRGFVVRRLYRQRTMETMLVAVTEAAMRGELDFAGSLHARVATLAGLPVEVVGVQKKSCDSWVGYERTSGAIHFVLKNAGSTGSFSSRVAIQY